MKLVLVSILVILLSSCGNQKLVENTLKGQIIGVVHASETDCKLYSVIDDAQTKTMYPVNLAFEYQVEGTHIQFDYRNSKAMQPTGCDIDQVISITEIVVLK